MMSLTPNVTMSLSPNGAGMSKTTAHTASATNGSASSAAASSASSIQSTFLNLLSQELQNQDPTAPVDSTQMVGQMISLNQLNQLVDINQTLSRVSGTTP